MISKSPRTLRIAFALVLAVLAWLAWSLVRVSTPTHTVSPAGVEQDSEAEAASVSTLDVAAPVARVEQDLPLQDVGGSDAAVDGALADLIGRVEGLELPHEYREVRVALWSEGLRPDCGLLASAGADTFPMRVVPAAPDGSFRFEGLPADGSFQLRAGGAAHVSFPLERAVQPSAVPVVLSLVRSKGLEIELVGRDGEPPRTHADLVLPGSSFDGSALMAPDALLETWEEELAAVPGAGCGASDPKLGVRFLLRGPPELSALGPIACDFRVAGYSPVSRLLWADPVVGNVPKTRVELDPTAAGWGSLELLLDGWTPSIRDAVDPNSLVGMLHLRYADGRSLQLPVRGSASSRTWDGIPMGKAEASFVSAAMFRWPRGGSPLSLDIAEQPSSMSVDLSASGALRVSLDPGLEPPAVHQSLALRWSSRFGVVPLMTRNLPTFLPVVEPGEWSVFPMGRPVGEQPVLAAREGIRVEAGAVTELVLSAD